MLRTLQSPADLWYFRKRMSVQMATFIFMTNLLSINSRAPHRVHFARASGMMTTSDMLPCTCRVAGQCRASLTFVGLAAMSPLAPEFASNESVPFRLTPNIQHLLLRQNIEGLLTATLVAVAHGLTEHQVRCLASGLEPG